MSRWWLGLCCAASLSLWAAPGWSQQEEAPRVEPGWLPTAAAVGPGFLVHGLGHMVGGDVEGGLGLLAMEGAGLGLFVAGGAPLVSTGASRQLIGPSIGLVMAGFGLFAQSWLADIYGASVGGSGWGPRLALPAWEAELGYRYIYDPQFAYRHFTVVGASLRSGPWRLSPSGWIALDDDNQRLRLEGAWRALGPSQGALEAPSGSFLDLVTALTWHGYGPEGFSVWTGELSGLGRLDLGQWGASLRGSFAEFGLGIGLEGYHYDLPGLAAVEDTASLLLGRFSYGLYLGGGGELALYYDHRHDDFAAGLGMRGLGGGPAGHFGVEGLFPVSERWALTLDAQVGSAYIGGLGLRWLEGGR
jgi:hypothetical protein